MQLRHLRYFVKVVDAGSISRAATTIHIAQPALSLQIAELEDKLGVTLLLRSARGVRPTAAGKALYDEAMALLRHAERIPGIVRSAGGEPEGIVTLGVSSTLASSMAGALMEACKRSLPRVNLRFVTSDSMDLRSRIDEQTLDLAIVFEDEAAAGYSRVPLFRQRLFLVGRRRTARSPTSIRFEDLAALPLVLPSPPNVVRTVLDRAFAKAGIVPTMVAETDVFSGMLSAVAAGLGNAILPRGDFSDVPGHTKALAQLIEPPLSLTANVIWSAELPLTRAGEEVRELLRHFVMRQLETLSIPGAETLLTTSDPRGV